MTTLAHGRKSAAELASDAERAAKSGAPAVAVRECTKRYGSGAVAVDALRGVALDIAPGQFVVILGPSGSGKTTLLNVIGGIETATSGSVVVAGADIAKLPPDELTTYRRDRIGFVFQFFNLVPTLTALENVQLLAEVTGADAEARSRAALARVGLAEVVDRFPAQLSGGQQQRVAIARALINQPSILLADEPTGNLDTKTSIEVMDIFQRLNRERNITVVLITHERDIAEYGTRTVSFRDGQVMSDVAVTHRRLAQDELAALPVEAVS